MLTLWLALLLTVADQASKTVLRGILHNVDSVSVVPGFFDLRFVRNTGAAWGIMQGRNDWLVALSVVMLAVIVFFRRSLLSERTLHRVALGAAICTGVGLYVISQFLVGRSSEADAVPHGVAAEIGEANAGPQ